MASEHAPPPVSWGRTAILAAGVFGCAFYYYLRFTAAFIHENESALRRAFPRAAETFLSSPGDR